MRVIVMLVGATVTAAVVTLLYGMGAHPLARPNDIGTADAGNAEFGYVTSEPAHFDVQPQIARYLEGLPQGARVLDLGCGNGAILASFRDRGWELVGVDISQSGIAIAQRTWPDIHFELADATGDLSRLGSFDAVISTSVIEHVFLPRLLVQNAFRALKPSGRFIVSTPYHGWLKNVVIAASGRSDGHHGPLNDYGHIKFWSPSTLGRLLWSSGFESVEMTGVGRVPYLWTDMVLYAKKP